MSANERFFEACYDGDLERVKYYLNSQELKEHADIHAFDDYGVGLACKNGHLNTVKYLLTSPELTEHANMKILAEDGFMWALRNGYLEIVKFLLASPELTEHICVPALDGWVFTTREQGQSQKMKRI